MLRCVMLIVSMFLLITNRFPIPIVIELSQAADVWCSQDDLHLLWPIFLTFPVDPQKTLSYLIWEL